MIKRLYVIGLLLTAVPVASQVIIAVKSPQASGGGEQSSPTGFDDYNDTTRTGVPGAVEIQP